MLSDIESIDNSTDDPDYDLSDQESGNLFLTFLYLVSQILLISVSSSDSEDFVKPDKKKKVKQLKKKGSLMTRQINPSTAGLASSPGGATFSLTQISEEHSQEAVLFRKCFDGER